MKQLVIIGAGGFGREVLAWAQQSIAFEREWTIKGFIDDTADPLKEKPAPASVLGRIADYEPRPEDVFVCAVGTPHNRKSLTDLMVERGGVMASVIHRTVIFGNEIVLGEGLVLCPYAVISSNARLGDGVAVNYHSTIDHDVDVGAFSQISCHCDLTGGVRLGSQVFVGSHASILPKVRVGDRAFVGAGSVVTTDVPADTKVFGVPARPMKLQ